MSDAETSILRGSMIGVDDFLAFNLKCLSTLQQVLESTGDKAAAIAKTLYMLMEPARASAFRNAAAKEGEAIAELDRVMRIVRGEQIRASRQPSV